MPGDLDVPRLAAASVVAAALMVAWLIVDHDLWERRSEQPAGVLTLAIGVLCMVLALFAANLFAALGSGLETDEAVRWAACGKRERRRRAQLRKRLEQPDS